MAQFSIPASPSRSILNVNEFYGIDYTNSPANVDKSRSPNGQNMIRDVPGKVRKRMGYETIAQYPARINGVFARREDERVFLVHAGHKAVFRRRHAGGRHARGHRAISAAWQTRAAAPGSLAISCTS